MKEKYILFIYCLLALEVKAQLVTGNTNLTIQNGATISINGLSLAPSQDFVLINNSLIHSDIAILGKPTNSINRVYKFSSQINFTGKIGMRYLPSELNGNNEELLQFSFAKQDLIYSVPTNLSTVNVNTHYLEEAVASKEMLIVTATESGSVLPVKLVDFAAISHENRALLSWSTSEESNSDFFEVQHSVNGKHWTKLAAVKASGESNVLKNYSYEHAEPSDGENFYRLKMVDIDGSFALSRVRHLHFSGENELVLHPNPVSDWVTIGLPDNASFKSMTIANSEGKIVYQSNVAQKKINLQKLPYGIYLINICQKDGTMKTGKIFKN